MTKPLKHGERIRGRGGYAGELIVPAVAVAPSDFKTIYWLRSDLY